MMKGSLKWSVWLFFLVVSFSAMEAWSLHENCGNTSQDYEERFWSASSTLSRFVWTITADFPPLPFIAGFLAGFLCCHFWWGGIVSFAPVKKGP